MPKRILSVFLAMTVFILIMVPAVSAAVMVDYNTKTVTIQGSAEAGKEVTIKVVNSKGDIDYIDQTTSGANGDYSFTYTPSEFANGQYTASIGGEGIATPQEEHFQISDHASALEVTWNGPGTVYAGETFDLLYGVGNVNDSIYAQDLTIDYDPAKVEFVSAEALHEGFKIVSMKESEGQLRIIAASLGEDHVVNADGNLLKLSWKAKTLAESAETSIALSKVVVSDGMGAETMPDGISHIVAIYVGIKGDLTGDGRISIGDLALIAKAYGKSSSDPDWNQYKAADLNHDGTVDIEDLTALARLILEQ